MEIIRLGEKAVILKAPRTPYVLSKLVYLKGQILGMGLLGIQDIVTSYLTLTVYYDPLVLDYAELVIKLKDALGEEEKVSIISDSNDEIHRIPVCYDLELAPDIVRVAEFCRLTIDEVISLHKEEEYEVAGIGFSPGFGFLDGLPDSLYCPRRDIPRKEVPAGAVGIAAQQTGIYPSKTSGGWNLIGRTPQKMVDFKCDEPSLLAVGDKVKFYEITREEFESFGE